MNNSLVENTDRVFIQDPKAKQQQDAMIASKMEQEQFWPLNWAKLASLIIFTFGLICLIWFISTRIQTMNISPNTKVRSVLFSYVDAGGLFVGLFGFYVLAFGGAWFYGSRQRERIKRQVVEKQLERERAMQALIFDQ